MVAALSGLPRPLALAVLVSTAACAGTPAPDAARGTIRIDGVDHAVSVVVDHGFDATAERCWFRPERVLPRSPAPGCDTAARVGPRRGVPATARAAIDLLVLHYDAAVTSSRCFEVLHDVRGLSVHFLLDLDGTLHQTCDLALRARHAGSVNDRSIGIEIAHPGAWPDESAAVGLYDAEGGVYSLVVPEELRPPPGGPFRAARPGLFRDVVNGRPVVQVDFTEAQYRTLEALLPELSRLLPGIEERVPRAASGAVRQNALTPGELAEFRGVIGHHHVKRGKVDPGPAFDWDRILPPAERVSRVP